MAMLGLIIAIGVPLVNILCPFVLFLVVFV
jgi:hypothetical protein